MECPHVWNLMSIFKIAFRILKMENRSSNKSPTEMRGMNSLRKNSRTDKLRNWRTGELKNWYSTSRLFLWQWQLAVVLSPIELAASLVAVVFTLFPSFPFHWTISLTWTMKYLWESFCLLLCFKVNYLLYESYTCIYRFVFSFVELPNGSLPLAMRVAKRPEKWTEPHRTWLKLTISPKQIAK